MVHTLALIALTALAPAKAPDASDSKAVQLEDVLSLADAPAPAAAPDDVKGGVVTEARAATAGEDDPFARMNKASAKLGAALPAGGEMPWYKLLMPMLIIAAAAGGVMWAKRKAEPSRMIQVMETAQVGKGRFLVVAKVAGRPMLIGSSDGGISLLSDTLPEEAFATAAAVQKATSKTSSADVDGPKLGFFDRILGRMPEVPSPAFDAHLNTRCAEDDELRRKLQQALAGRAA